MSFQQVSVVVDDHIFLSGRPPLSEYLGFVMGQTVDGAAADRTAFGGDPYGVLRANGIVRRVAAVRCRPGDAVDSAPYAHRRAVPRI